MDYWNHLGQCRWRRCYHMQILPCVHTTYGTWSRDVLKKWTGILQKLFFLRLNELRNQLPLFLSSYKHKILYVVLVFVAGVFFVQSTMVLAWWSHSSGFQYFYLLLDEWRDRTLKTRDEKRMTNRNTKEQKDRNVTNKTKEHNILNFDAFYFQYYR